MFSMISMQRTDLKKQLPNKMKVIVAGFSKTGTNTMATALGILGYSVYHWEDHFIHLEKEWLKILNEGGRTEDFYHMYKNVDAAAGIPFSMFWEEISEAFPEAKIIFLQRSSEDEWEESAINQLKKFNKDWKFRLLPIFSYTGYKFFNYLAVIKSAKRSFANLRPEKRLEAVV
ncbi:uncharacterized protein LOC120343356 [Styela clava]